MRKIVCFLTLIISLTSLGQRSIAADTSIITDNTVTINGQKITYQATTGTQPLWDEAGEPIATLHYTYYKLTDTKDIAKRPLLISFNGGPGSASAWMHIAYTGPKLLEIDDEGYPVQPYGIKDNPYSVLDATDILYIHPVNTGYSRTIPVTGEKVKREKFFGRRLSRCRCSHNNRTDSGWIVANRRARCT